MDDAVKNGPNETTIDDSDQSCSSINSDIVHLFSFEAIHFNQHSALMMMMPQWYLFS